MQYHYDLKRYAVLYVDDEEMALKYFEKAFGREFRIITASNAADGLKLIEERGDEIAILLTDQRMPGEKGVKLLERARTLRPRMVRMLITAYADFGVTVDAVNMGNIFRYISKPLQVEDMMTTLRRAMEFYMVQLERDELLREKLSSLQNMLITDRVISLGVLAAGLSRQLSNPLQAVQRFLQLTPGRLEQGSTDWEKLRDPAFWRDFHGLVVKQATRISALLGELTPGPPSVPPRTETIVNTGAVFDTIAENYRKELSDRGIELKLDISSPLPNLSADPQKFEKIFDLLLRCELGMLFPGSSVSLAVTVNQSTDKDPSLHIVFRDDGPGLPPDTLRAVFDPFFIRTDGPPDFGLNLMGVYFLVYHLGGQISGSNSEGAGLNFHIELPLQAEEKASATATSRDFVTNVLMNDSLWERLLPHE